MSLVIGLAVVAGAVGVGYPLVTGRIRVGGEVVDRATEPARFWRGFAVAVGGLVAALVVVGVMLRFVGR